MLNNATGILEKLAKSIARILLVAGLESGTSSRGVGAVTVLDDDDFLACENSVLRSPMTQFSRTVDFHGG